MFDGIVFGIFHHAIQLGVCAFGCQVPRDTPGADALAWHVDDLWRDYIHGSSE
jgi:hypothetical protein